MADRAPARSLGKFAYDVGVNVLANLVAAAVIYLVAVAGGYISKDPELEALSGFVIYFVVAFAVFVVFDRRGAFRSEPIRWTWAALLFVSSLGVMVGMMFWFCHQGR